MRISLVSAVAQVTRVDISVTQLVTFVAGGLLTILVALLKRIINTHDDERLENKKRLDALVKTVEQMKVDISVLKDRAERGR